MTPLERIAVKAALRNIHADDEHPDLSYERGMEILENLCRTGNSGRRVLSMLQGAGITPQALRMTKSGQPGHPLYVPYSLQPQPLQEPAHA